MQARSAMNELRIFENVEFGKVRTIEIDGKPYFVANDVARALGYTNPSKATNDHCKNAVMSRGNDSLGREQEFKFIPEGDIYRLIIRSNLPAAERFERWIFDDVIPSIRKNGGYIANQENLTPEQIVANALVIAQKIISDRDKQIQELKPKAEFFDAVTDSKDAIPMADVAKVLDMGIGRNKLFEFLRSRNILMSDNRPYQKYVDAGYFRVVEQKYDKGYGEIGINIKTLVFQKGIDYIRRKLKESGF
jgi:prophage antirepressor-like protein